MYETVLMVCEAHNHQSNDSLLIWKSSSLSLWGGKSTFGRRELECGNREHDTDCWVKYRTLNRANKGHDKCCQTVCSSPRAGPVPVKWLTAVTVAVHVLISRRQFCNDSRLLLRAYLRGINSLILTCERTTSSSLSAEWSPGTNF